MHASDRVLAESESHRAAAVTRRVLWLLKGLGLGGAERLVTLMAPRLDPARFEVDVAYLLPWKDALVGDLEREGVETVCLGARRTADPEWVLRLRSLLRERSYDLVHTHSPVPAAAARLFADRRHTRLLHTEHNVWERYGWPTYAVNAATYSRNHAVLAVSDEVARSVAPPRWLPWANYPPVATLLHGVDVDGSRRGEDARTTARKHLDLQPQAPVVATVGNLTPKKDHATLVDAADRLRERHPGLVTLLIGTGPLASELEAMVSARGLEGQVRLLGMRDDVADLLPAVDVFVLSSRFEGLPLAMLEAMAAERACVLTRVGGIPEAVVDGEEGLLVEPGDPTALAAALDGLLRDPDRRRRLGRAARQRVARDFSVDRAVGALEEIYDRVLRR